MKMRGGDGKSPDKKQRGWREGKEGGRCDRGGLQPGALRNMGYKE